MAKPPDIGKGVFAPNVQSSGAISSGAAGRPGTA